MMSEVDQIMGHINTGKNFLLSGGAGSGKTYTLVEVIKKVLKEKPSSRIACMTYTNAAVKEIEERVNHENLNVSTIHDLLWDNIKYFQGDLKKSLVTLVNDTEISKVKIKGVDRIPDDFFDSLEKGIQYKEYTKLSEGIISHDEILLLAEYTFRTYPKLCDIVKDKYPFIFVDEYQDTDEKIIKILLEHFTVTPKQSVIGFFGDAMQSIYDNGIGNIDSYKGEGSEHVQEVKKEQNRRNPQKVIDLANIIRTDGIVQTPSTDLSAPNMTDEGLVKQGEVLFLYSTDGDLGTVKTSLGWDFSNSKSTKELNLTHNLIASKAKFRTLMDIYDKDPVLKLKNDILKRISTNEKAGREPIAISEDETFDSVVDKFQLKNRQRELKKDIILSVQENSDLYGQLSSKKFSDVRKIYLDKDQLIDDKKTDEEDQRRKGSKRDALIRHLYKLQRNIWLYQEGRYNEFMQLTDYRLNITSVANKRTLKDRIDQLINVGDKTIEQVIDDAHDYGICFIDDKLERFKEEKEYVYNRVKDVPFSEFQSLFEYLEGRTPFSTQHKTKGAEFDNVLVILDNGNWNDYNFKYLFTNRVDKESVLNRTRKIFYVCCTRAREKLAVYYHDPDQGVINTAIEWFGEDSVIKI